MKEASRMYEPPTFEVSANVISSPGLESGATRSDWPDGRMTDLFGVALAPVQVSPVRAKAKGLMTLATSGRLGIDSSASASLQRSLENSLMTQLDSAGSTLFKLTWKAKRTPLGRRYLEQQALAHRTPGCGFTSVPTPRFQDDHPTLMGHNTLNEKGRMVTANGRDYGLAMCDVAQLATVNTPQATDFHSGDPKRVSAPEGQRHGRRNNDLAMLAAVPTPMAGTPAQNGNNAAGNNDYSRKIVELASVSTPRLSDPKSGHSYTENMTGCSLPMDANLATCATPRAEDSESTGAHRGIPDTLNSQANLATLPTPNATDGSKAPKTFAGGNLSFPSTAKLYETGVDPDGSIRSRLDQLPRQAQLAASGETATGGTAKTASTDPSGKESLPLSPGQLNAGYSRWLMGLPPIFDHCVIRAMRNLKARKKES